MPVPFKIKKNLITKKTSNLNVKNNCYSFFVDNSANKIDIKKNIEESFDVKVKSVNTVVVMRKMKKKYTNNGMIVRNVTNMKKAYVYLQQGEHLDFNNFIKQK
jgi:large subunit ribosomal protein L23